MGEITTTAVLKHAYFAALDFFGWNRRTLVAPAIVALGFIIDWYRRGWDLMFEEYQILLSHTVLPLAAFIILLFLANLWLAPFRLIAGRLSAEQLPRATERNPTTQDGWYHVENLRVWQAAYIIENVNPKWPMSIDDPAYPAMLALENAIARGELQAIRQSQNRPGMSQISREALIDYYKRKFGKVPELYTRAHLRGPEEEENCLESSARQS